MSQARLTTNPQPSPSSPLSPFVDVVAWDESSAEEVINDSLKEQKSSDQSPSSLPDEKTRGLSLPFIKQELNGLTIRKDELEKKLAQTKNIFHVVLGSHKEYQARLEIAALEKQQKLSTFIKLSQENDAASKQEIAELSNANDILKQKLLESKNTITLLEAQLSALFIDYEVCKQSYAQQLDSLEVIGAQVEKTLVGLQQESDAQKDKLKEVLSSYEHLLQKFERIGREAKAKQADLQQELERVTDRNETLRGRLISSQKVNESSQEEFKKELESISQKCNTLDMLNNNLTERLEKSEETRKDLEKVLLISRHDLQEAKTVNILQENAFVMGKFKDSFLCQELSTVRRCLEKREIEVSALQECLDQQRKENISQREKLLENLKMLQEENRIIQERLTADETQIERLKQENSQLNTENGNLLNAIQLQSGVSYEQQESSRQWKEKFYQVTKTLEEKQGETHEEKQGKTKNNSLTIDSSLDSSLKSTVDLEEKRSSSPSTSPKDYSMQYSPVMRARSAFAPDTTYAEKVKRWAFFKEAPSTKKEAPSTKKVEKKKAIMHQSRLG